MPEPSPASERPAGARLDGAAPGLLGSGAAGVARAAGVATGGALLTGGILAASFNMRAAISGLPPVFPELRSAAGLTSGTEAVLAAVPVLGFAACAGVAPALARKLGEERVLGLALAALALGLGSRAAAPGIALFPGTVLASCAIALMNVLLPSLIKRRRPELAGLLIGLYLMSLTGGAVLAAAVAVPVFTAAGGSGLAVRLTLGMWALPAAAAALAWLPQLRFRAATPAAPRGADPGGRAGRGGVLALGRQALAWQVALFMGLQSFSYYATSSWFPTMFRDHGISAVQAGNLVALMTAGNVVTGLIAPILAQRARDQRLLAATAVAAIAGGMIGSTFATNATVVAFVALLGLGQGAAFGLSVYLFTARARDARSAAALSGFAQGTGYLIASAGPLMVGYLHAIFGGWAISTLALLGCAAGQLVVGLLAGRPVTLSSRTIEAD